MTILSLGRCGDSRRGDSRRGKHCFFGDFERDFDRESLFLVLIGEIDRDSSSNFLLYFDM
jgi:hypothetical protein